MGDKDQQQPPARPEGMTDDQERWMRHIMREEAKGAFEETLGKIEEIAGAGATGGEGDPPKDQGQPGGSGDGAGAGSSQTPPSRTKLATMLFGQG